MKIRFNTGSILQVWPHIHTVTDTALVTLSGNSASEAARPAPAAAPGFTRVSIYVSVSLPSPRVLSK